MVAVNSTMLALGTSCPDFDLPDPSGARFCRDDFADRPLIVAFICNHCPFVIHLNEALAAFGRDAQQKGAAMVAISSNDIAKYPQDRPELMQQESDRWGYTFPYLHDASQDVAKAFRAACTPDFYLFDAPGGLAYRGQFDDSRPGDGSAITGADLRAALDAVLAGRPAPEPQKASIGCNIKWRPGGEPPWFGAAK